jgi:hypothetical protein
MLERLLLLVLVVLVELELLLLEGELQGKSCVFDHGRVHLRKIIALVFLVSFVSLALERLEIACFKLRHFRCVQTWLLQWEVRVLLFVQVVVWLTAYEVFIHVGQDAFNNRVVPVIQM